jgi:hypothetical protein
MLAAGRNGDGDEDTVYLLMDGTPFFRSDEARSRPPEAPAAGVAAKATANAVADFLVARAARGNAVVVNTQGRDMTTNMHAAIQSRTRMKMVPADYHL